MPARIEERLLIRRYARGEEAALHDVFFTAVHLVASRHYSAEQIQAWAPREFDTTLWRDKIRRIHPFVAELDGKLVGYADIQPSGHIDHFFVSGHHPHQGIGSLLMQQILSEAQALKVATMTSEVSLTAQPLFQKFGFQVAERRYPVVRGVMLANALMRRRLAA